MPVKKYQKNATKQSTAAAKPSLTQQRAADAQKRKEERDAFFVWVFNGLCQTDKNFEPFEDAARAKFGETLNSLLERMQLWLKRTKKAQPAYWLGRRGGRHRGGIFMGLVDGDKAFEDWGTEVCWAFSQDIEQLLHDAQKWLKDRQNAMRRRAQKN